MKFLAGMTFGAVISALTWGAAVDSIKAKHQAEIEHRDKLYTDMVLSLHPYERRCRDAEETIELYKLQLAGIKAQEETKP